MKNTQIVRSALTIVVAGLVLAGCSWNLNSKISPDTEVNSYESCVAAGGAIMESYPEQCSYNGQTYTRELRDDEPQPGSGIDLKVDGDL